MGEHCHYPKPGWFAARLNIINTWRHSMARVHVMGGYLNVEGFSGGYPDQGLPGISLASTTALPGSQPGIDNSLPPPPPGVWPPPVPSASHRAITRLDASRRVWPSPGPATWRCRAPRPDQGLPGSQPSRIRACPVVSRVRIRACPHGPEYPSHPIAARRIGCCATRRNSVGSM